jgi:hypothetical protein
MTAQHKVFSDFEVFQAEDVNNYLMNQTIVKVANEGELNGLPTDVKTAYVLNTGILMARNAVDAWVPQGGAAAVSETAPANPQVGALWVKPSEVLPAPVRGMVISTLQTLTATAWSDLVGSTKSITLPKAAVCTVSWSIWTSVGSAGQYGRTRLAWTGALTGDSYDHAGYGGVTNNQQTQQMTQTLGFSIALPAGTTTFKAQGYVGNSTTMSYQQGFIDIAPMQWADAYAAGVS